MKLATWAKDNGVSRRTATRWFHSGVLVVGARQLAMGTIVKQSRIPERTGVALYSRVSSGDQGSDLDRQVSKRRAEAAMDAASRAGEAA